MIAVTVNHHPIDVPAIVERGRVFLPLRTVFTELGAAVSYDAKQRVIVARTASHTLRLPIAAAPVRIAGGRAYVPLRYVAESLGASVVYDAASHTVRVDTPVVNVAPQAPVPNAIVASAYPAISASLGTASASAGDITLVLDGTDVTQLATFDGSTITFLPRRALSSGRHTVTFSGRTIAGDPFSAAWSFDTTVTAPPESDAPRFTPADYHFYADRSSFYRGDWMHFTLVAPPGGSARLQLCNGGYEYPFRSGGYGGTYEADIPAPLGYSIAQCPVRAIYTSWNGTQTIVPVPLAISLFTMPRPTPRPSATPVPQQRRIEPMPRRPEPSPKPSSTP